MKKIKISGQLGIDKVALVDDEDYEELSKYKWYYIASGYVVTFINKKMKGMHRIVMNATNSVIDHKNGNPLDNRKENLRHCTHAENQMNSRPPNVYKSNPYKGVMKSNSGGWMARLTHKGTVHQVSSFSTARDAALMYNYMAKRFFGEFAWLNDAKIKTRERSAYLDHSDPFAIRECNKDENP